MSMKNPLTLAGIEPGTFRFVAQHLNHCGTAGPLRQFIMRSRINVGYCRTILKTGPRYKYVTYVIVNNATNGALR